MCESILGYQSATVKYGIIAIRNQVSVLAKAVAEEQSDAAVAAALTLLAQFLVDVNKIAAAMEKREL